MSARDKEAIVRDPHEAFDARDLDRDAAYAAEDAEWGSPSPRGDLPRTGGLQAVHAELDGRVLGRKHGDHGTGARSYFDLAGMMVQPGLKPAPEGAEA